MLCSAQALLAQAAQRNSVPLQCSINVTPGQSILSSPGHWFLLCASADFCVAALSATPGPWSRLKWSNSSRGEGMGTAFLSSTTD